MEEATYYTKSKMMFDISDFYLGDDEEEDEANEPDVRSSKLTNRSIHTIKKKMIREETLKVTPEILLTQQSNLSN